MFTRLVASVFLAIWSLGALAGDDLQTRTFKYFLEKAEQGDKNAQFIVGSRYENGNGTDQDMEQAFVWYRKAAAQGHEVAQTKLDAKAGKKPVTAVIPAAPRQASAPKTAAAEKPARPEPRRAPRVNLDPMAIVLGGDWASQYGAAEYLPSGNTSCAQASNIEVICFSNELTDSVGGARITYSVKSTMTRFNDDGSFEIRYVYNVSNIDKGDGGKPSGRLTRRDIALTEGWQEPGKRMRCRAKSDSTLECVKDSNQTLRFSKK